MKFLKNNLKAIITFLIGVILAGGIVYAATSANQVTYTISKNAQVQTVADALNDLYANYNSHNNLTVFSKNSISNTASTNRTTTINLPKGKYLLLANEYNSAQPDKGTTIEVNSTNENIVINKKDSIVSYGTASKYGSTSYLGAWEIETTENNNIITIKGNDNHDSTTGAGGMNYIVLSIN